jgi:hypothetical protein
MISAFGGGGGAHRSQAAVHSHTSGTRSRSRIRTPVHKKHVHPWSGVHSSTIEPQAQLTAPWQACPKSIAARTPAEARPSDRRVECLHLVLVEAVPLEVVVTVVTLLASLGAGPQVVVGGVCWRPGISGGVPGGRRQRETLPYSHHTPGQLMNNLVALPPLASSVLFVGPTRRNAQCSQCERVWSSSLPRGSLKAAVEHQDRRGDRP